MDSSARVAAVPDTAPDALPGLLRTLVQTSVDEVRDLEARVAARDRQLTEVARRHPDAARLQQVPGVGVVTATAFVGAVGHIHTFRRGRDFASWLGLTPRESTTGMRGPLIETAQRCQISRAPTSIKRRVGCNWMLGGSSRPTAPEVVTGPRLWPGRLRSATGRSLDATALRSCHDPRMRPCLLERQALA